MKIYEQCYYIKPVTYDEYRNRMKEIYKDESSLSDALSYVSNNLKEA